MQALARRLVPAAAALALALAAAPAALAQGIIVIREPERRPVPEIRAGAACLEVRSLAVEARIRGRVATTAVDQVFFNPSASELEGTYLFPLPEGAAVEKFSMFVDGAEVAGELLDAERARGIYESIVRARRDPALLEFVGTRLFRASIFPIPPRSEKRVKLSYSEMLAGDSGTSTWRFPLGNARHAPRPIGRASLVAEVESARRLTAVFSPTHRVDVARKDDRHARVSWEESDVRPDQDFTLILQEPAGDLGFSFAADHPAGEDGTFLLLLAPGVDAAAKPIPRDVVFCCDTSGSMAGEKIEQARNALRYGVRSLSPEDRFALVTFATEPRRFREGLVAADADAKEEALRFIDGIQAVGGTCIDDALQASLAYLDGGEAARPAVVLFVTDGLPTIGEREPAVILERARKRAASRVRLFAFGVGFDVNARLLDGLAEDLRGARDHVAPKEDIEQKVSALVAKTTHPVMTDVTVSVEGVAVHDLYPRRLPDLFLGSELAVLGRYGGGGSAVVRVKGRMPDGPREFVNEVTFPAKGGDASFLGRLWATRRVGHLMDEIRLHGESRELKDEVVRLAKRYGILTPYTSYLVLENEEMLARFRRGDTAMEGRGGAGPSFGFGGAGGGGSGGDGSGGSGAGSSGGSDDLLDRLREEAARAGLGDARFPPALDSGGGTPTPAGPAPVSGGGPAGPPPAKMPAAGEIAVRASLEAKGLKEKERLDEDGAGGKSAGDRAVVRRIGNKTFYLRGETWVDAEVASDAPRKQVKAFSDDFLALAAKDRDLAKAFALGRVVVKVGDTVYEVVPEIL